MITRAMVFRDRHDAGRRLAQALLSYADKDTLVLALPRGGVEVGYEIARALDAPLDVIVARKIGAPNQRELGIGAIAPGGVRILDDTIIRYLGIPQEAIDTIVAEETREMERRLQLYRGNRPAGQIRGRTVILVDDGLATGVTARAAIQAIKQQEPEKLILAVPVAALDTAGSLQQDVDELVCLHTPADFRAVGIWYDDFSQTTDEQILELLQQADTADRSGRRPGTHESGP